MLLELMFALTCGIVEDQSETPCEGRCGYGSGKIRYVYRDSPAKVSGIKKGDIVLEVDGKEHNCHNIHGTPGTVVHIKLRRKEEILEFDVMRTERWRIGIL